MFTKRTIKPHREVTSVETASEALALSIGEKARVDLPYMEQLTGKTQVRLCEGIAARSDTLKEKLQTIRADEHEQQRKELMKNEHRRRSGRTNRPNELGGL